MTAWARCLTPALLLLTLLAATTGASADTRRVPSTRLFTFADGDIFESSGLVDRGRTVFTVDDSGISRRHLEIVWDGRRAEARDLGSTNGSTLNGARLTRAALPNESMLQAGRTRMLFRVVARARER